MKNIIKTPSFIRLAVLTVLHALYAGFIRNIFYLMLYVCYSIVSLMNLSIEAEMIVGRASEDIASVICLLIPLILGFILVDRLKWWQRSLPIQILLGAVTIYISYGSLMFGADSIGFVAILSMFFLIPQVVGVGIKTLWLKWKARKRVNQ